MKKVLFLLAAYVVLCAAPVWADDVTLCWDAPVANTDGTLLTDLEGFFLYWSTTSGGPYTDSFRVTAKAARCQTLTGFAPGDTYYFVATAYNVANLQSDYSNEAFKSLEVAVVIPMAPANLMAE